MVMLCAAGLLEKAQGRHRNAPDVERFLVEGSPGYMGPWITFTKPQWNEWGRLAEHIRTKELKVMGAIETFTVADARRYHNATYSIGMGAGRRFVRQVDLAGRKRIMDIGGGSGAYCIAAAKEHAGIRAVVLDLPVVCEVTREFIAENGVADRVEAQACDFTRDPFPTDCDVAIMASNLPMYSREMIAGVIRKAHDALLPGGEMHLIGETTNNERTGPWGPAYWGLGQAIGDSLGLAHSEADVIGYFRAAGFADVARARIHRGLAQPHRRHQGEVIGAAGGPGVCPHNNRKHRTKGIVNACQSSPVGPRRTRGRDGHVEPPGGQQCL